MHIAISFKTSKFDVSKENKNPINPIYGESLLIWLKSELCSELEMTAPDAEDWGWYSNIIWKGREYMLGSSVFFEEGDEPTSELKWIFQVDKQRSFKEILLGREKMTKNDECVLFFKSKFKAEPDITSVLVE